MRLPLIALAAALIASPALAGPDYTPRDMVQVPNADWTADAVLYQLNTRQFTREGTFTAAQKQLPRLAAMGVDIIWLMPIHPIGAANRKGSLGSPYAVRDYRAVNPEFGTQADLTRGFIHRQVGEQQLARQRVQRAIFQADAHRRPRGARRLRASPASGGLPTHRHHRAHLRSDGRAGAGGVALNPLSAPADATPPSHEPPFIRPL